jgi:hypothetical protein
MLTDNIIFCNFKVTKQRSGFQTASKQFSSKRIESLTHDEKIK